MTFPRIVSGYTDAAQQQHWKDQCEREAKAKYAQAKKAIKKTADLFRGLEDQIVDGIDDMEEAKSAMNFIATRGKQLADLYEELYKCRINLNNMGLDPDDEVEG